jgi:hypothetical protein
MVLAFLMDSRFAARSVLREMTHRACPEGLKSATLPLDHYYLIVNRRVGFVIPFKVLHEKMRTENHDGDVRINKERLLDNR